MVRYNTLLNVFAISILMSIRRLQIYICALLFHSFFSFGFFLLLLFFRQVLKYVAQAGLKFKILPYTANGQCCSKELFTGTDKE